MARNTKQIQASKICYMVVFEETEYEGTENEWDEVCYSDFRLFFVSASSTDDAIELAEDRLEAEGYGYDETSKCWTDDIRYIDIKVLSVLEHEFWASDYLGYIHNWQRPLCAWAEAHPEEATQLWQIAKDGASLVHQAVANSQPIKAIAEANLLNSAARNPSKQSCRASKSI